MIYKNKGKNMLIRFLFETKNCKFRKYKNSDNIATNDKRTTACKQYKAFCEDIKKQYKYRGCWSENPTETSCVLVLDVKKKKEKEL